MEVWVNGELVTAEASATISAFLTKLGLDPRKVAVELNQEIVPRGAFDEARLKNQDRVEIVHFVGGG